MEDKTSIWNNSLTYGLILGILISILMLGMYVTNTIFNPYMSYLYYIVMIIVIIIAIIKQRSIDNDEISYGKALGTGTVVAVSGSFITGIFIYILYKYIDTGLLDKYLTLTEETLYKKGLGDDEIEQTMSLLKNFTTAGYMAIASAFNNALTGLILSLIISAVLKRKNNINE